MTETTEQAVRQRLVARLARLYGPDRAREALPELLGTLVRGQARLAHRTRPPRQDFLPTDVILIAYPDHLQRAGQGSLPTLGAWCRRYLRGLASTIHVLPFHPSTSYEGYAITDYLAVDPRLGSWDDLADLGRDFDLMFDVVLNHCSASHPWFLGFRADQEPFRRYFVTVPDPEAPWLAAVKRARNSPLLTAIPTAAGTRHVWTTYSSDLVDLDWREPAVLREFLEVILDSVVRGARILRLDAFVYVWKEPGTNCVARPEGHELLSLFQDALELAGAADVKLLPSITNVSQTENSTYLGCKEDERKADLVYMLPLAGLLLHALYRADARLLSGWLARLPPAPPGRAYLPLAATHDGIGLTWLADLVPARELEFLVEEARVRGALLSSRRPTRDGSERPWEINATWFSACAPGSEEPPGSHPARLLATQAIVLALRGVPALYLPLFLAGRNDRGRAEASGDPRAINRGRFALEAWEEAEARPESVEHAVLAGMLALLRARVQTPAFHPLGAQRVVEGTAPSVLGLLRTPPGEAEGGPGSVLALHNLAGTRVDLEPHRWSPLASPRARDLLTGQALTPGTPLALAPYQVLWIEGLA